MKGSDSQDSQQENVTDLLETNVQATCNRGLLSRKKSQLHGKLQRYEQRLAKIQSLLASAQPGDVGYLTNCMQSVLAKRERCCRRAEEIRRIQEEMDSFKQSVGNLETRARDTDLASNQPRESVDLNNRQTMQQNKGQQLGYHKQQVEAIIQTKEELLLELRGLEDAADSLTRTINDKQQHLQELEDTISEHERQLKKLKDSHKRHRERAVEEEAKLKALEKEVAKLQGAAELHMRESDRVQNGYSKQKLQLSGAEKRHAELCSQISRLERSKEQLERQMHQGESRLKAVCSRAEEFEQSLRKSRSQQSEQLEKAKALEHRCHQLTGDYDKLLERVAKLKEEEVQTLAQLQQLEEQLEKETQLNDKLVEEDRQLQRIIQDKYTELQQKLRELEQTELGLQEYTRHKKEMLAEFQSIELQKTRLFGAVSEKESQYKQAEQRKQALEERIGKMEQEAHRYQRLFTEYNTKIQELTSKIVQMSEREKSLDSYLSTMREDETELVSRINELQKAYSKTCLVSSFSHLGDSKLDPRVRERVQQISAKLQTLSTVQKSLQQQRQINRRLRVELDNLKAIHQ